MPRRRRSARHLLRSCHRRRRHRASPRRRSRCHSLRLPNIPPPCRPLQAAAAKAVVAHPAVCLWFSPSGLGVQNCGPEHDLGMGEQVELVCQGVVLVADGPPQRRGGRAPALGAARVARPAVRRVAVRPPVWKQEVLQQRKKSGLG